MEATLKVIRNLRNIRNMDILVGLIILHELKVHLLCEEELQEEIHQFSIFLELKEVICEHGHTAADY